MTGTKPPEGRVSIQPFFDDLKKHLKKTTVESLKANKTPKQVHAVADTVMDAFSSSAAGLEKLAPPEKPIACKKGCAHCCHLTVLTDGATVLRIAEHVRTNMNQAERMLLDMRLIVYEDKVEKMTQSQRSLARIPCPLLVDGACSVHEVRPLICRAFNSYHAEACDRDPRRRLDPRDPLLGHAVADRPRPRCRPQGRVGQFGYKDGDIELGLALKAALDHPHADERWLAGVQPPPRPPGRRGSH